MLPFSDPSVEAGSIGVLPEEREGPASKREHIFIRLKGVPQARQPARRQASIPASAGDRD